MRWNFYHQFLFKGQSANPSINFFNIFTSISFIASIHNLKILLNNFRILTSVYEALTIHHQLKCTENKKDFLPLWFLYCIAAMNTMLVNMIKLFYFISHNDRMSISFLLSNKHLISRRANSSIKDLDHIGSIKMNRTR